jgi:hypothetical protein
LFKSVRIGRLHVWEDDVDGLFIDSADSERIQEYAVVVD